METTWVNVVDTTIKIGLGSLITAISGYLILRKNHLHEVDTENRSLFYKLQEEKKIKYVEFLSQSQALIQSHNNTSCTCDTEEYKEYLKSYNAVQIISTDEVRTAAFDLLSNVNQFITIRKDEQEPEILKNMRQAVNNSLGLFQKLAQVEVTKKHNFT